MARMKRLLLFAFLLPFSPAAPAAPVVGAVDPPNWWVGSAHDPVQILVRGERLAGAALRSDTPSVTVLRQTVNAAGTYLIAYVHIERDAKPGRVALRVEGPDGSAPVPFELREPLPRAGRFGGLTPDDVIYLVMPDRFLDGDRSDDAPNVDRSLARAYHGGDLRGIRERLPYLKELGVTVVWMTPFYDNDDAKSAYHGYHATDFYAVEEHFGTFDELVALVDEAHRLGIKIMQDQVANHTGDSHPWIAGPPTPTWYNGTPASHLDNNFRIDALVDPKSDAEVRRATLEGWFAGTLPDLDQNDEDAAAYLVQNSLWWIGRTGIDAIRQDTLPYAPRAYWSRWITALRAEYPTVTVLGEVFNDDPKIVSYFQGGVARDGVDSHVDTLFDFPLGFALVGYVTQQGDARHVADVLAADTLYTNPRLLVPFLGNHDTARAVSMLGGDPGRLRLAHTVLMTLRGAPQIYYGDEIGMAGAGDPDCRRDFPGGFPGDARDAFSDKGRTPDERATFDNLRRAIALRRAHPALRGATTKVLVADGPRLAYVREGDGERALVAVNASDVPIDLDLDTSNAFADGHTLTDAVDPSRRVTVRAGRAALRIAPRSAAVLFNR